MGICRQGEGAIIIITHVYASLLCISKRGTLCKYQYIHHKSNRMLANLFLKEDAIGPGDDWCLMVSLLFV